MKEMAIGWFSKLLQIAPKAFNTVKDIATTIAPAVKPIIHGLSPVLEQSRRRIEEDFPELRKPISRGLETMRPIINRLTGEY